MIMMMIKRTMRMRMIIIIIRMMGNNMEHFGRFASLDHLGASHNNANTNKTTITRRR